MSTGVRVGGVYYLTRHLMQYEAGTLVKVVGKEDGLVKVSVQNTDAPVGLGRPRFGNTCFLMRPEALECLTDPLTKDTVMQMALCALDQCKDMLGSAYDEGSCNPDIEDYDDISFDHVRDMLKACIRRT